MFKKFKDKASASVRKAEGSAKVSLESLQNIPIIGLALYWTICTFFFGILGALSIIIFPILFLVAMVVGFWMICAMAAAVIALPYLLILGWGEYGVAMNLLFIFLDIFAIGVTIAIWSSMYD